MTAEDKLIKMLRQVLDNQRFLIGGIVGTGADYDAGSAMIDETTALLKQVQAPEVDG